MALHLIVQVNVGLDEKIHKSKKRTPSGMIDKVNS